MNTKAESQSSGLDMVKWIIVVGLFVAGYWGFYYFQTNTLGSLTTEPLNDPIRWLGMLGLFGLGFFVAITTAKGRRFWEFMKSANLERKKVVWPTGPETRQTTWLIFVVVVIIGIFLAILDWIFSSAVTGLVG